MKNKKQDNPREMNLPCGYCRSKDHQLCPGAVRNGVGVIWTCPCGCDNSKRVRCLTCKTELLDPVAQHGWKCMDKEDMKGTRLTLCQMAETYADFYLKRT